MLPQSRARLHLAIIPPRAYINTKTAFLFPGAEFCVTRGMKWRFLFYGMLLSLTLLVLIILFLPTEVYGIGSSYIWLSIAFVMFYGLSCNNQVIVMYTYECVWPQRTIAINYLFSRNVSISGIAHHLFFIVRNGTSHGMLDVRLHFLFCKVYGIAHHIQFFFFNST